VRRQTLAARTLLQTTAKRTLLATAISRYRKVSHPDLNHETHERPRKLRNAFVAFAFWCSLSRALNLLAIGIHVLKSLFLAFRGTI
jgi:uncharacterized protein YcsI (UPF0317 family)